MSRFHEPAPVRAEPVAATDERVVADLGEFGLHLDASLATLAKLKAQDLTGFAGPVAEVVGFHQRSWGS